MILDYVLPGMDGEEAARGIRKAHPNSPIILSLGGFSTPGQALESANKFVSKGAGSEALIEVLEQQLQPWSRRETTHGRAGSSFTIGGVRA